jgi:hypothetical protein
LPLNNNNDEEEEVVVVLVVGVICIKRCRNFCALFVVLFQIGTLKYKIEWNFVLTQRVHFPVPILHPALACTFLYADANVLLQTSTLHRGRNFFSL